MLYKGATLHIKHTGPSGDTERGHLFVVLTNVCSKGRLLLVPISSAHQKCDKTCLLGKGDHPFLKHDSFIQYALATLSDAEVLLRRINKDKDVKPMEDLDEKLLARVCLGVPENKRMPPLLREYYDVNKLNPIKKNS